MASNDTISQYRCQGQSLPQLIDQVQTMRYSSILGIGFQSPNSHGHPNLHSETYIPVSESPVVGCGAVAGHIGLQKFLCDILKFSCHQLLPCTPCITLFHHTLFLCFNLTFPFIFYPLFKASLLLLLILKRQNILNYICIHSVYSYYLVAFQASSTFFFASSS